MDAFRAARPELAEEFRRRMHGELPDGTPFPTTYYATCPRLTAAISTLETQGVMRDMQARLADDEDLAAAYARAHTAYLVDRAALGSGGDVPEIAGVSAGGMPDRVKCLHVAHHALGLQGADCCGQPGTRGVVGRRERGAVGQPRGCAHDVGTTARAAVSNSEHSAWLPAQLPGDRGEVFRLGRPSRLSRRRHGAVGGAVTGSMPAVGRSASCTDCQIWPYQGASPLAWGAATEAPETGGRAASSGSMTV